MEPQAKFEGYAVVEIMGHNIEIGYVTTEYFGGPALFRVDQPPFEAREYTLTRPEWIGDTFCGVGSVVQREAFPGKTVFVGPSSIFRMTPCTEETARTAIEKNIPAPIKILSLVESKRIRSSTYDEDLDPVETDQ
jgi:hypothetical protein